MAQAPKTTRTRKVNTSKPAPKKVAAKPAPKKEATKKAAAPKVNPHVEGGVKFERYAGPSKGNNGLRPVKIMKKEPITDLTDRCRQNLYALRDQYKGSSFQARGLDNGILRDLLAAGLISVSGGQTETRDGREYILDGATPVQVKITAAGQKYGAA